MPRSHDGIAAAEPASMIGSARVVTPRGVRGVGGLLMMWRLALCVAISGCWPHEPLVDGTFTREEWSVLQTMQLPAPELCPGTESGIELEKCGDAALFGQVLFFEPALSGKINIDDP